MRPLPSEPAVRPLYLPRGPGKNPRPLAGCAWPRWHDSVHIRRLAIEVDRDDGLRSASNGRLQHGRVHRVADGINVHKHRTRASGVDCLGRGNKGVCNGNHFISVPNSKTQQSQVQGGSTVRHGDAMTAPQIGGKSLFEFFDFRSKNEMQFARTRSIDFLDLGLL